MSSVTHSEAASATDGRTRRPKLMIVDDDPEVRIIVAEFLRDIGYEVIQAPGGAEALNLLEHNPDLRMIITDIRMPDMSGIELARSRDAAPERSEDHPDLRLFRISAGRAAVPAASRSVCVIWKRQ